MGLRAARGEDGCPIEPELVLRRSRSNRQVSRNWLDYLDARLLGIVAVIVVVGLVRDFASRRISWTIVLLPAAAAAFFAYYCLRQANVTMYVRGDRIGVTNWLGVRKEVARHDVAAIVMCSVSLPQRQQPLPMVVVVSKSGRCLFTLSGADELGVIGIRRLSSVAGLELRGSWTDALSLAGLEARYPGSAPPASGFLVWLLSHRSLTSAIAVVATILVFVGLVVLRTTGH
jgi:hypothetical protein